MSFNHDESPMLTAWKKYAPVFVQEIEDLDTNTARLIRQKTNAFKRQLERSSLPAIIPQNNTRYSAQEDDNQIDFFQGDVADQRTNSEEKVYIGFRDDDQENEEEYTRTDFMTFKQECHDIFATYLPPFQAPAASKALKIFFQALAGAFVITFAIGLGIMVAAKIGAFLGIVAVSGFNFTALAKVSAYAGTTVGSLALLGTFSPSNVANHALNQFEKSLPSTQPAGMR